MAKLIKSFVIGINKSSKNKTIAHQNNRFERFVEDLVKYSDYNNFNL
ncbi:MAG: hypothetical protein SOV26_03915 [Candidatus Onthovivens sp.]|nr:hypothetical protein [Candidatus Onthovivens sp.]